MSRVEALKVIVVNANVIVFAMLRSLDQSISHLMESSVLGPSVELGFKPYYEKVPENPPKT